MDSHQQTGQAAITTFAKNAAFAMLYCLLVYAAYAFLYRNCFFGEAIEESTLARWDAYIYHELSQNGVSTKNPGIYPLFSWVWRICHVGYMGMAVVNMALFSVAFAIIQLIYPVSRKEQLLWLTTPSLYFMMVPYTEALFCLLTAVAFYGIHKRNMWLIWGGLMFASLTRATALFMIPSLLIMELITAERGRIGKALRDYGVLYALPVIVGTAWFVLVQYYSTGIWFAYYKEQATSLGHVFSIPALPFDDFYGTEKVQWLCGLALFVCVVAMIMLLRSFWLWLLRNRVETDKILVFSLGYFVAVMFTMVTCNPKWGHSRTNLLGIHRYTFCSAFFFVFLYHFVSKARKYVARDFIVVGLLANIVWLTMGSYTHLQILLCYNLITLLVLGYMAHANKKDTVVSMALMMMNILIQILVFHQFIAGAFTD